MDKIALKVEPRTVLGKAVKQLRRQGLTPAVVYGHGQAPVAVAVESRSLEQAHGEAGSNKIIALKIADGEAKNALIYAVQAHPLTGLIQHADFYLVRMDEKLKTEVPLHFTGEAPAVFQQDGTLVKNLELIEVEALPADLPEAIEVNIDDLDDFEKSIAVSDLVIPPGVTILVEPETLVVKVDPPRSDEELAELDEVPTEELPPEVTDEAVAGEAGEGEATAEGEAGKEQPDQE